MPQARKTAARGINHYIQRTDEENIMTIIHAAAVATKMSFAVSTVKMVASSCQ